MTVPSDTIVIGRTLGVFGIKGECKVEVFSDSPERFLDLKTVWATLDRKAKHGESLQALTIESVRVHKGRALVKFRGYDTPEQLEPVLRLDLHIPKSDRQPLAEGEYYIADLLGMDVRLPDGTSIGAVHNVIETGANHIYEVVDAAGKVSLIPAIAAVVQHIDLGGRVIDITPLPGLLD